MSALQNKQKTRKNILPFLTEHRPSMLYASVNSNTAHPPPPPFYRAEPRELGFFEN